MCDNLEDKILHLSRNGQGDELSDLIQKNKDINLNCKGKTKSNKSWTPLHLASYFGHMNAVEILLGYGSDPNIINHTGDTALHKAALTSREDVVLCLLHHNACTAIINDEGKKASQVACDVRIKNILEAAEKSEVMKKRENFIQSVKEGDVSNVKDMLSRNDVTINMKDDLGNTALHHAALRDQRAMAVILLQHGADPAKLNKDGQNSLDLCQSQQMRKLLEVRPLRHNFKCAKRFEGPLLKKKRFLGPHWHWVVLERGVISYFAKRADAAIGSRRKMFKYLTESKVTVRNDNQYGFTVQYFDGSRHNLMVHQHNDPLVSRQKWIDAIREHAEYSNHFVVADHVVIESDNEDDDPVSMVEVKNSVQDAQAHHQVLKSHIEELTGIVQQLVDSEKDLPKAEGRKLCALVLGKCHKVLTSSTEMSNTFSACLSTLELHDQARESQLTEEREKNRVLEQALQALATEHHNLERTISSQGDSRVASPLKAMPSSPDDSVRPSGTDRHTSDVSTPKSSLSGFLSDEDEFYDAVSGDSASTDTDEMSLVEAEYSEVSQPEPNGVFVSPSSTSSHLSRLSDLSYQEGLNGAENEDSSTPLPSGHRTSLPVTMFSRDEFSIWHILRQCIGKELSKITMPVIFNEPLSFIQRLCEYMEYSRLLQEACKAEDSVKRMEYVAAFAISALASQLDRLGKPFNPLLGETYEYKRDDLGFHWVSEQVSHHPPVSAFHAHGTDPQYSFQFSGSVYPKLKFWGKSVEIEPKGTMTLKLGGHDETYTWVNPKLSVHNIVVGKLWMEQHGLMEIVNHKTNERCQVTFKSYSWFRNDLNKIEAFIYNGSKEVVRVLEGNWTKYVYSMHPDVHKEFVAMTTLNEPSSGKNKSKNKSAKSSTDDIIDALTSLSEESDCSCLWMVQSRPANSTKMYNMTHFAMTLNEEEVKGYDLAPTDSRVRPDIRTLENGDIDGAAEQKHRLEEKQRAARKLRHKRKIEWTPMWFSKKESSYTKSQEWTYNQLYDSRDWSNCPDIF